MMLARGRAPRPKYTMVGETLRYVIPSHLQCSMACGGRSCKYEDPSRWGEDMQAIKGLYSSWVTDELLAMARPSTEIIQKYDVIEQFQRCGIRTLINLQHPGEHASCGNELEQESGFTYRPEAFMEAGIYYYNYAWRDYGVASLATVLDMAKVMSFAVQEGKVAVHCHAGLGRTGVLLACHLVFTTKMSADQAIAFVREKRPGSVQTRAQLLCVRQFAQFLVPLRSVFPRAEPESAAVSLSQYLTRQRHLLHGPEARRLRHTPKVVALACQLLLDVARNRQVVQQDVLDVVEPVAEERRGAGGVEPAARGGRRRRRGEGLSYSERDRGRPGATLDAGGDVGGSAGGDAGKEPRALKRLCLSHEDLRDGGRQPDDGPALQRWPPASDSPHSSTSSVWDQLPPPRRVERPRDRAGGTPSPRRGGERRGGGREDEERPSEVPFILLQTELSLEARRLLVAQALAVDLERDGGEEQRRRVSWWQMELNSGGDVWDSVCAEQDPFVLSGLMWSWLEQLKEPVLSRRDVQALEEQPKDPSRVFNTLDKGPRQTLTCILHCAAQVMAPSVESAFLDRTIKAFTKMKAGESEEGRIVYKTMRRVLALVLKEMKAQREEEDAGAVAVCPSL
ncbi:protein tyrosine phosphatase domain-containing protein 1-like [Anguilla anguilla]|uniref:protein tyrosine phosphatase domain-containing protein 1-like n=1 Tax=Anguilla anguilla TaxID=7936 RepID=UPI0015ACB209|nr:protein tyrosine phosphatase domain-containing protein 1-like [Anguilla anguilla]